MPVLDTILYGFDFSYITTDLFPDGENHPLSDTLRFTFSIGWGGASQPTRERISARNIKYVKKDFSFNIHFIVCAI